MIFLNGLVEAVKADITEQTTDAIVNAANSSLMGGGGVDGAIHRKGGPEILEECRNIRKTKYPEGLPPGEAVSTLGGNLRAKWVIHTVGPVWHGGSGGEDETLRNAYLNSLSEALRLGCKSVSFPSISTGIYSFPRKRAAKIVSEALKEFFESGNPVLKVFLVFYSDEDYRIFIDNQSF
jgi:O-acetyl-ADP-ribose deacetylase (regulator of RNase III)